MSNLQEQLRTVKYCSKSMTCIEDLSNELFYEIFEYLNICDIYEAFSNLNIRFQNLLTYSSQPIKIDLCEKSEFMLQHYWRQGIIPHKNRIISIRLPSVSIMMKFCELIPINSSLTRLESLILNGVNSRRVLPLIYSLKSLPRLFSLTVEIDDNLQGQIVYQFLSCLSVLKYCKISSKSVARDRLSWPPLKDAYINSIEHLVIDHECTINELFYILSYTPRLCYLNCKCLRTSHRMRSDISSSLSNLKYISINNRDAYFDEFETFFKEIHSQIEVLRFKTSRSMDYVDANRWERLILHNMPHLHTFYLQCSVTYNPKFRFIRGHGKSNGFTSSFWIERQWIFELKINVDEIHCIEMIYSIHPYRKDYSSRFIDQNSEQLVLTAKRPGIDKPSIHLLQSAELVLTGSCSDEEYQLFISGNSRLFKMIQISHLNIDNYQPSIELLIKLLRILPNIHSLRISSFPIVLSKTTRFKGKKEYDFVSNNNNITKVYLGQMDELKVTHFIFMNLWTRIQYLEVTCTKEVNVEMMIQLILKKHAIYIPHLRSLCLCVTNVNDEMVKQLQIVIDLQKLLDNYTIKHRNNRLYVQWK